MNGAELFVKCLEEEGVSHIYGVPGEENEDLLFALQSSNIEFVPTRHEQGAAFIANVYGRLTGKAGVCLATLGPGATNLITGVADAYLDKAPLVAITGQGARSRMHHESHQMIDIVQMFEAISKYNTSIQQVEVIPEIVRKAFKIAETEKPGAVHIEMPEDIASELLENNNSALSVKTVRRPSADSRAIREAEQILNSAEKVLILAGNGAIRKRSSEALYKLIQSTNIRVANTFMGKGAISSKDLLSLGTVGLGFKDYIIEAFEAAEVVVCVGYDIAEYDPKNWNIGIKKKIVHIDFEPSEVFEDYIPDVEIVGDICDALTQLELTVDKRFEIEWTTATKNRIDESIAKYTADDREEQFDTPMIINAIRQVMPDDGLLISDVGTHKMWIARNYNTYCPNGCIISNGLASMGIALPGGIAAKSIDKNRAVVSLMGDGGALMNFQEIETAKRLGLGYVIIIANDNNYGLITWKQKMHTGESTGTALTNPDFVKLGESFGIDAYKPKNVGDFKQILQDSFDHNRLTLIEIPISTDVNQELINELKEYYNVK